MIRVVVLAAALAVILAACGGDATIQTRATATASPTSAPTATAEPTVSPTPPPTPEPEVGAPEIVSFTQGSETLWVRLHNPNETVGLIRAGFELAVIDQTGAIVTVAGTDGFLGAECCTIYQLPPGSDFGMAVYLPPGTPPIGSLELAILDQWTDWGNVNSAVVTIEQATIVPSQFTSSVTGRASVDQPGPFNAWIGAFADSPSGPVVLVGFIECLTAGAPRAFEITAFTTVPTPLTLTEVVSYPTTVAGHGDGFTPDC